MGYYRYSANKKRSRKVDKGVIEAKNQREALVKLKKQGFINIHLQVSKNGADNSVKPLSLKEKIDFTQTFQTLHQSGIPIIESLVFIGNDSTSKRIRTIATSLRQEIMEGATFAGTIAKYTNIFDKIYIGLVKAGEDSGEMDKTLGRLSALLKKQSAVKNKVIGALLYPVFVIILAIIIVLVMVTFVFPEFAKTFAQTGRELPAITQACITLGTSIQDYWYLYISGAAIAVYLMIKSVSWGPSRAFLDKLALKVPLINNLILKSDFSNFLTVLLVAYNAGIPIVDCVYLANLTITNGVIHAALNNANLKVQQGAQLSVALKSVEIIPNMITFMISTGEQSGRLNDLLENAVYFIDEELDKAVDIVTKMMEPLLIVVIGFIVLFMALAFYLPLFGLSQGM